MLCLTPPATGVFSTFQNLVAWCVYTSSFFASAPLIFMLYVPRKVLEAKKSRELLFGRSFWNVLIETFSHSRKRNIYGQFQEQIWIWHEQIGASITSSYSRVDDANYFYRTMVT